MQIPREHQPPGFACFQQAEGSPISRSRQEAADLTGAESHRASELWSWDQWP